MNIIKGTVKTYNGTTYAAKAAFNTKYVDYFKENSDSEAELLLDPSSNEALSGYSNASIFVLNESHAVTKLMAQVLPKKAMLEMTVGKMDFEDITNFELAIPTEKVVYISNRPLFSAASKKSGDNSDISGGENSGTFVLAMSNTMGMVLYWTSADYDDVLDSLISTTIVEVPDGTTTIDAVANAFYAVTTHATGSRKIKTPDAKTYKGCSITIVKVAGVIPLEIARSGADTINGGTGFNLVSAYDRTTLFSTGTEWIITELYID